MEEKRIEHHVMKTLRSLDALEDIDAHPFLQTRLQAQIREYEANKENSTLLRLRQRDLRPALLVALLLFNILSVIFTMYYQSELRASSLSTFAEEYALTQEILDFRF